MEQNNTFQPKVSFDLYETLEDNQHILEVYFTKDNNHFFNKHFFQGKDYGFLKTEAMLDHVVGEKRFYKTVQTPNPKAEIVATLSREQILSAIPVDEADIFPTVADRRKRLVAQKKKEAARS